MTTARVDVASEGGGVRIAIAGEVDLANAAIVEEQIVAAITNQVTGVSVDLGGVDYIDSAGLRIFFALGPRLAGLQITLELVAPVGSPSRRLLEVSGLPSLVTLQPPMDGAAR
ncbi:MAG TPA: STAS domain-containing protein [Acidimicrobiales bacterium]|nr:STAS domain-containing protein [Acidimicrobiales bacterium]